MSSQPTNPNDIEPAADPQGDTGSLSPEWQAVLDEVNREMEENAPIPQIEEPEHSEPKTLSERIKADPELCAVLERRPQLCALFEQAAARLDTINGNVNTYLSASPQGFEQMLWALVQLEIEVGPDGKPVITPTGQFSFPLLDDMQRTVFERFLSWQRRWYLWPQLEHRIKTSTILNEEHRRCAVEAITQTRILLGEAFPQSAGVC